MADENSPPVPPAPAHENELFRQTENPVAPTAAEKIRAAGASVLERFGIKPGRGRPRADGKPKISDRVEIQPGVFVPAGDIPKSSQPATLAAAPSSAGPRFDGALVRKCVASCLRALTGWADRVLYGKALHATRDAAFSKNLVAETTVDSSEVDSFSQLAEICFQKWGVGSQYAPEVGLGVIAAGAVTRYALAFKTLDEEIQRRNAPVDVTARIQQLEAELASLKKAA